MYVTVVRAPATAAVKETHSVHVTLRAGNRSLCDWLNCMGLIDANPVRVTLTNQPRRPMMHELRNKLAGAVVMRPRDLTSGTRSTLNIIRRT